MATSLSFLLAGYETTSTALAYSAWLLAAHPNIQAALRAEAIAAFPDAAVPGVASLDHDCAFYWAYLSWFGRTRRRSRR